MPVRPKLIGLLTPSQTEIIKTLYDLGCQVGFDKAWKPKELGAFRSSSHALTLKRLEDRGLVEKVEIPAGSRKFSYRLSPSGIETWELFKDTAQLNALSLIGGAQSQSRFEAMQRLAA